MINETKFLLFGIPACILVINLPLLLSMIEVLSYM